MKINSIVIASVLLGLFGLVGTSLVSLTETATRAQIEHNRQQALLTKLEELIPADSIDNNLLEHIPVVNALEELGRPQSNLYLGTREQALYAIVYEARVPNGYAGVIELLVAVKQDGSLGGVRVVSHKETPGLGDKIELKRSDWALDFNGKSLQNPPANRWKVKKDGGDFDQFTGATITPRSIVSAVKSVLIYHGENSADLYADYLKNMQAGKSK
ncbi:hypothetical protein BOW50_01125 [Solemya velum gill symbiont]|uniref:electron transport complex subunit RsxG n=1 Tax=Solemya velum gill symbiont TaxID=2340 RepID=UPI000996B49C|nr:electron transport complex subunit RsxG [Solemya velum gill symbiont]OOZ80580.1 hypothetical protein BOW50_01125 [Solemya velum gill symbiont]